MSTRRGKKTWPRPRHKIDTIDCPSSSMQIISSKLSKKLQESRLQMIGEGRVGEVLGSAIIVIIIFLIGSAGSQEVQPSLDYYAQLPRLGPIRGLRLPASSGGVSVAFLGIPYAAPPVGQLRLMPPMTTVRTSVNQSTPDGRPLKELARLMPAGGKAIVRFQTQFGYSCVHLPDWLPKGNTTSSDLDPTSEKQLPAVTLRNRRKSRDSQSEDCLNLNVFVPIRDESTQEFQDEQRVTTSKALQKAFEIQKPKNQKVEVANPMNKKDQDSISQVDNRLQQLWPITSESGHRMPVVVLLQTQFKGNHHNDSQFLDYLSISRKLNSIVITFNHRSGLLGFLPLTDKSSDLGARGSSARSNHALWDHIGLLHWLKYNILSFDGDPHNITLVATDNRAAQLLGLLAISPLAKGLFSRVVISYDQTETRDKTLLSFDQLVRYANESRECRRKLTFSLAESIRRLSNSSDLLDEDGVNEFIQSADLNQLAVIDNELKSQNLEQLYSLLYNPSVDDKLLFPHLTSAIRIRKFDFISSSSNYTRFKNHINYCLYVSRLYSTQSSDYLNLSSDSPSQHNKQQAVSPLSNSGPIGEPLEHSLVKKPSVHDENDDLSELGKAEAKLRLFGHIYNLHRLSEFLKLTSITHQSNFSFTNDGNEAMNSMLLDSDDEDEDDDENKESGFVDKRLKASILRGSQSQRETRIEPRIRADRMLTLDRNRFNDLSLGSDIDQLMSVVSSYDLLMIIRSDSVTSMESHETLDIDKIKYKNVIHALHNFTGGQLDESKSLIEWSRYTDLHAIASWMNDPKKLNDLCNFRDGVKLTRQRPTRFTSFVSAVLLDGHSWLDSLLNDSLPNVRFSNFLRLPTTDWKLEEQFMSYEPLDRKVQEITDVPETNTSKRKILDLKMTIALDIIPYLRQIGEGSDNVVDSLLLGKGKFTPDPISKCLMDLESNYTKIATRNVDIQIENSSSCIPSTLKRLRSKLRKVANDDLDPIISRLQRRLNLQRSTSTTNNDGNPFNSNNSSELMVSSSERTSTSVHLYPNGQSDKEADQERLATTRTTFKGFFAKAYKDAVGKALAVVVGTGLIILALNMMFVLVIVVRFLRRDRPNHQGVIDSTIDVAQDSISTNNGLDSQYIVKSSKSNLKKQEIKGLHLANGDLTSANMSNQMIPKKKKKLKFNLAPEDTKLSELQDFFDPEKQRWNQQQQVVLMNLNTLFNGYGEQSDELILNPPIQIMDPIDQPQLLPQCNHLDASSYSRSSSQCNAASYSHHNPLDLSSPFASISHSTSMTSANDTIESLLHQRRMVSRDDVMIAKGQAHHYCNQRLNNPNLSQIFSTTSPGSSTEASHSMVDTFAMTTCPFKPSLDQPHSAESEPYGLIYATEIGDFTSSINPLMEETLNRQK